MSISTYSELQTAVENWLQDTSLSDRIPEFIAIAEARFKRVLPTIENETTASLTVNAETVALPSGFQQLRGIYLDTDPRKTLQPMSLAVLRTHYAAQTTGEPEVYALTGTNIVFGPSPDTSYTAKITYVAELTALSDSNTTNWLLTSHPDLYLYQTLLAAHVFGWEDARIPLVKAGIDEIVDELTAQSNRKRSSAAPQRLRPSVIEVL